MNNIPAYAMDDFLEIIHTYGSYLKERQMVRNFNESNDINKIKTELNNQGVDYYSSQYLELGISSGISKSELDYLKNKIDKVHLEKKDLLVKNLISTEKFFKKLKHEFNDKYPELKDILKDSLKKHQNNIENNKIKKYKLKNEMISLSSSFLSFFKYNFCSCEGIKIAYYAFAIEMRKKYNIKPVGLDMVSMEEKSVKDALTLEEINLLASVLENFIKSVKEEDLINTKTYINNIEDGNITIKEKEILANKIINKEFNRFKKLYDKYNEIKIKL